MTFEIALLLALLAAAFLSFARGWLPVEVTALALLAVLIVTGLVDGEDAFIGFSNRAVIAIGALFVLSSALSRSGVLEPAIAALGRIAERRHWLAIGLMLTVLGLLSGFLNNTAVVAMGIPFAIGLCQRAGLSPSRVLLPLSYAAILGGTLTLIGTSTNILVSSIVVTRGHAPIGMFELARLGFPLFVVGVAYVMIAAPRLLPERAAAGLTARYGLGSYLSELRVLPGSKLVGQSAEEAALAEKQGVTVLAVLRDSVRLRGDASLQPLEAGDLLIVEASPDDLLRLRQDAGLALLPEVKLDEEELRQEGLVVIEAIVPPTSAMVGRTLAEFDFRRRFGAFVLAVRRHRATVREKIGRMRLHAADSLLVLVSKARLPLLSSSPEVVLVSAEGRTFKRPRAWWLVLVVLPATVLLAALGVAEIALAALIGAIVLLVASALSPQQAYRSVDWSVLFLIAAFVPVGQAMLKTGAADLLAEGILAVARLLPEAWVAWVALSLLYLITQVTTEAISNNAAAIMITPVALSLSTELGVDPRPFIVAVCFAASASFMTPLGYQTNLMVMAPGSYRFGDYLRLGAPLSFTAWLMSTLLIPRFWPF